MKKYPKVRYRANLYRILNGLGYSLEKTRAIRSGMDSDFFTRFGMRAIDTIYKRTVEDGRDKFGKKFEKYSESYKNSQIFKIHGKTNHVNLLLSGDMMSNLFQSHTQSGMVTIEVVGDHNNAKAHGHENGIWKATGKPRRVKIGNSYRSISPKKLVKRPFLGLSETEERRIFRETMGSMSTAERELFNIKSSARFTDERIELLTIDQEI